MNKLAAYEQGVIEGLSGLDLPRNVKLAAYQFLVKQAGPIGDMLAGGSRAASAARPEDMYPGDSVLERAANVARGAALNAKLNPDVTTDFSPEEMLEESLEETGRLPGPYDGLADVQDRDYYTPSYLPSFLSSAPEDFSIAEDDVETPFRRRRGDQGAMARADAMRDIVGGIQAREQAKGMRDIVGGIQAREQAKGMSRVMDEISPSYLQTALNLAKENPGLATAAGLGTVGLGYGASRLLS